MGEITREEFTHSNFGPTHRLDIRATIGRLTVPSEEVPRPQFRASDVVHVLRLIGFNKGDAFYHTGNEIQHMLGLEMIEVADDSRPLGKHNGIEYARTESEQSAVSWELVRAGALAVVRLFPDDPRNSAWLDWSREFSERPPAE